MAPNFWVCFTVLLPLRSTFADFTVFAFFMSFLLPVCSWSSAVDLKNQETRFISEVIGSAVVTETSGQQCNALLLQVSVKLRFLMSCWLSSPWVLSLQHHQSCPPPPSLCPWSSLHRGKEEWRACSFFIRMWPRSEITSTHIPLART